MKSANHFVILCKRNHGPSSTWGRIGRLDPAASPFGESEGAAGQQATSLDTRHDLCLLTGYYNEPARHLSPPNATAAAEQHSTACGLTGRMNRLDSSGEQAPTRLSLGSPNTKCRSPPSFHLAGPSTYLTPTWETIGYIAQQKLFHTDIMASHVSEDGVVHPPLDIAIPAPSINLKGFHWATVDEKLGGHSLLEERLVKDPTLASGVHEQQPLLHSQQAAVAPGSALPAQLSAQLVSQTPSTSIPKFPLSHLHGPFAGKGFNLIFRPRASPDLTSGLTNVAPDNLPDNILQLSLTTEQWTFGDAIGNIPNRGMIFNNQPDITLNGFPYLQTVKDVTNKATGKNDNPVQTDIHFEPGMFLIVPETTNPRNPASVVRMASIPHGTTINAQGLAPKKGNSPFGGVQGGPVIGALNTTPFNIGNPTAQLAQPSMNTARSDVARLPQDLHKFDDPTKVKGGSGMITTEIIQDPNLVLKKAIQDLKITETITFEVFTGNTSIGTDPTNTISGGGTSNISFLAGGAGNGPNAQAASVRAKFWIEHVAYSVTVPPLPPNITVNLRPTLPIGTASPIPEFAITSPAKGNPTTQTITVPGIQFQYSQTIDLNFGPLTWPHVSVATLVPATPQPFVMK